jgi:hypothetical protein
MLIIRSNTSVGIADLSLNSLRERHSHVSPLRWFFIIAVYVIPCTLTAQGVGVGRRIDLTQKLNLTGGQFAQLFVPDYFVAPSNGDFLLTVHLHSASWAAENQVYRARASAILFNIHLGALSSPYQSYFGAQTNFQRILDTVVAVLHSNSIIAQPRITALVVTSFSAGYAGVREILKNPFYYNRINALTLADGLHCNSDSATMRIQMQDFLRFARDARDRKKAFLLTHSSIVTSGYENTTSTSTYLIGNISTQRLPFSSSDEIGIQYSRADTGHFHVRGYWGTTADDHLKHLYGMHLMLGQALHLIDSLTTDLRNTGEDTPEGFHLEPNYPNPFNPRTTLRFAIGSTTSASLTVHDLVGREVATLLNQRVAAGSYNLEWNATGLASGVYFCRLATDDFVATRKLQLLK